MEAVECSRDGRILGEKGLGYENARTVQLVIADVVTITETKSNFCVILVFRTTCDEYSVELRLFYE